MHRNEMMITSAIETIVSGEVLHVRADRLAGSRNPKRFAMPVVDLTVGPDGHGGFVVVRYETAKSGVEHRHETAVEAIREVRMALSWDRIEALSKALTAIHGAPEKVVSRFEEEARIRAHGARLNRAYGHKPGITGPIFGPSGVGR